MDVTEWIERRPAERDRRRHPRYEIDLPGSIVYMARGDVAPVHVMVRLESISKSGMRVRLLDPSADLGPLETSKLLVINHESQRGQVYRVNVVWASGGRLGLELVARSSPLEEGAANFRQMRATPSIERLLQDLGRVKKTTADWMSAHSHFRGGVGE